MRSSFCRSSSRTCRWCSCSTDLRYSASACSLLLGQLAGCRMQAAGFRLQAAGCRLQASGRRLQAAGCRLQAAGCRLHAAGFRLQAAGCGLRASGIGHRAAGFGLQASGDLQETDERLAQGCSVVDVFVGCFLGGQQGRSICLQNYTPLCNI